jgi:hypothetical protein
VVGHRGDPRPTAPGVLARRSRSEVYKIAHIPRAILQNKNSGLGFVEDSDQSDVFSLPEDDPIPRDGGTPKLISHLYYSTIVDCAPIRRTRSSEVQEKGYGFEFATGRIPRLYEPHSASEGFGRFA